MKTIAILGSTGSIGRTTLKVISKYKKHFKIVFLYADKNYKIMNSQSKIFKPKYICLNNIKYFNKLNSKVKKIKSIDDFFKSKKKIDYVISAISGFSAININFKLLKIAKNLLIANKETLICGGKVFLNCAKRNKCKILPIDSEHYCINYFLNNFKQKKNIKLIYLMASGGPFLKNRPKNNVSLNKVLKHPNWKMGKKISICSANLTNKILELFEAHVLFNIPVKKLNIKIEKSSKVHSIISLNNNLDFYILHNTSMEIPIENSLIDNEFKKNKINNINNLSFLPNLNLTLSDPKIQIFPILKLGYRIIKYGYSGMIIFTVLNDRLVEMFLEKKIYFNQIVDILLKTFKKLKIVNHSKKDIKTFKDINRIINFAENIKL